MSSGPSRVELTAEARRALNRLPAKAAAAAVEFCFGPLSANPHRLGKPLTRELTGYHSARRGTYRVVYSINDEKRLVHVVCVEHRSDVYRPR